MSPLFHKFALLQRIAERAERQSRGPCRRRPGGAPQRRHSIAALSGGPGCRSVGRRESPPPPIQHLRVRKEALEAVIHDGVERPEDGARAAGIRQRARSGRRCAQHAETCLAARNSSDACWWVAVCLTLEKGSAHGCVSEGPISLPIGISTSLGRCHTSSEMDVTTTAVSATTRPFESLRLRCSVRAALKASFGFGSFSAGEVPQIPRKPVTACPTSPWWNSVADPRSAPRPPVGALGAKVGGSSTSVSHLPGMRRPFDYDGRDPPIGSGDRCG